MKIWFTLIKNIILEEFWTYGTTIFWTQKG